MDNFIPASIYCNNVFDGTHETPKHVETGRPFVTSKNIMGRKLNLSTSYNISESDYNSFQIRSKVSQWDVLFSLIGSVGEVYLEKEENIPYAIKNIGVFSCKDEYKAKWLYYYLQSPYAKSHINSYLRGAVQKFLSLGLLREFPIPQYDKSKNKIIDCLFNIDTKIELNARINAELESMAKTLYDYWFVQFKAPLSAPLSFGHPPKYDMETLGNTESQPVVFGGTEGGRKMVWNEALKREIPLGWEVKTLGDIVSNVKENTSAGEHPHLPYVPIDNLPMKKLISAESSPNSDASSSLVLFKKHDILVGAMRVYFHRVCLAIQDGITRTTTFVLCPKEDYLKYYSLFTINKDESIEFAKVNSKGTTMPYTFWDNGFEKLVVLQPPKNLLEEFNKIIEPLLEQSRVNELESQTLTGLRDWLLPMLMNGQVKVG